MQLKKALLFAEFCEQKPQNDILDMLNILFLSKALVKVKIKKEEHLEAKKLCQEKNIPYVDCLNAVQARNYGAVMVSQDLHYLKNLRDVVKTLRLEKVS